MRHYLTLSIIGLVILISFMACRSLNHVTVGDTPFEVDLPPGTLRIDENFYADKFEITNIDYREFMYWTSLIYGKTSNEYLSILPDTMMWATQTVHDSLESIYLRSQAYDFFPVVGVTLVQAQRYAEWRTNAVAERLLIVNKLIAMNLQPNRLDHFTIQHYVDGTYQHIIERKNVLLPTYRIPTIEQWKTMAGISSAFILGVDNSSSHNKKILKRQGFLFNTSELVKSAQNKSHTQLPILISRNDVDRCAMSVTGLYNTIGNVAELVADGKALGGDWQHSMDAINVGDVANVNLPNCYTGFRTICSYVAVRVE